jgi:hypothetical protein
MAFDGLYEEARLLLGEDYISLRLHLGTLDGIQGIVADQTFFDRLGIGAVQGDMDQLDRAFASTFHLHPQVKLAHLSGEDGLQSHPAQCRQDIQVHVLAVVPHGARSAGQRLPGQPALHVLCKGDLRAIEGQAVVDLIQGLIDPVPAFLLRLGILGEASAVQADLGAPAPVLALEDAAFVVAAFACHVHFSFL